MLIDWFTVGAQALNFLILVWLLKRFLYRPILDAIAAREASIALELKNAAAKEAAASVERDSYARKNSEFDAQRTSLLGKATDEAKAEKSRLLDAARVESEGLRSRLQAALRSAQQSVADELGAKIREEVFAIARKTLADLASASLEASMASAFVARVRSLSQPDRVLLASGIGPEGDKALVRSAFELTLAQRTEIQQAVAEVCGAAVPLNYETAPALLGGIELHAGGRKLAWSISEYLDLLQKSVLAPLELPSPP